MMDDNAMVFFEIFPWTANFETGIELIDEQHKKLVDILNQLAAHLANRSDAIKLNIIFDELADYADYHFKSEEKIWSEYFQEDEWYTDHERTHGSFIEEIVALRSNADGAELDDVVYDVVTFLSKWLAYHILDTDKRMALAVQNIRSGYPLQEAKADASEKMTGFMKVVIETVLTMYESLSMRTLDLMREKSLRIRAEEALNQSEERWKFILEGGSDNVWDWDVKHDTLIESGNQISVFDTRDIPVQRGGEVSQIHPSDAKKVNDDLQAHLEGKTDFYINKHRVLQKNGSWSWVLSRGKVISRDQNNRPLRMVGTNSDITERELASLIHKNSSQAIYICDSDQRIVSINPAFTKITGYSEEESIGKKPNLIASGMHDAPFYAALFEALADTGFWSGKIINKRKNGELFSEFITIKAVKGANGEVDHYIAMFNDITEEESFKKQQEEQKNILYHHAYYDTLTNLPNRTLFNDRLSQAIEKAKRHQNTLALFFIDLDHFKHINDSLGHEIGDKVLQEIAHRLHSNIRKEDTLARFGGDEFVLLAEELLHTQDASQLAQKLLQSFVEPIYIDGRKLYLSTSIGISLFPKDNREAHKLIMYADTAMYRAKYAGRNNFQFYSAEMTDRAYERVMLETSLRQALENDEFIVYYQPQINGNSGALIGMEALVRWNHPTKGLIPPSKFIPVAEETGLIVSLDRWVMKTAMNQIRQWYADGFNPGVLALNLAIKQLQQKDFMEIFKEICTTTQFEWKWLELEITESQIMTNPEEAIVILKQISERGVQIAIDDFGTGYSSLSYLKRLPIDKLKIDKSFVDDLPHDDEDAGIAKAVIALAKSLKLSVIAEGVETAEQKDFLIQNGCENIQGFLYAKPIPAAEMERVFLKKRL